MTYCGRPSTACHACRQKRGKVSLAIPVRRKKQAKLSCTLLKSAIDENLGAANVPGSAFHAQDTGIRLVLFSETKQCQR